MRKIEKVTINVGMEPKLMHTLYTGDFFTVLLDTKDVPTLWQKVAWNKVRNVETDEVELIDDNSRNLLCQIGVIHFRDL